MFTCCSSLGPCEDNVTTPSTSIRARAIPIGDDGELKVIASVDIQVGDIVLAFEGRRTSQPNKYTLQVQDWLSPASVE